MVNSAKSDSLFYPHKWRTIHALYEIHVCAKNPKTVAVRNQLPLKLVVSKVYFAIQVTCLFVLIVAL